MKLKDFRRKMEKDIFTSEEAHIIGFRDNLELLNLQLHQWEASGELIRLKRGLYMFADAKPPIEEIASRLYSPCYFSLEYVLSMYSIIPEAVFTYTLVTPKTTRRFHTPIGTFSYQKILKRAFTDFDPKTIMAQKEKALVDYFYLHKNRLLPDPKFWEESRLNAEDLNFKKIFRFAKLFRSVKLFNLLTNFYSYAKTQKTHR